MKNYFNIFDLTAYYIIMSGAQQAEATPGWFKVLFAMLLFAAYYGIGRILWRFFKQEMLTDDN